MILISQKSEVQDFNGTKYSPGNQVGGLPGALHWKGLPAQHDNDVKNEFLSKFTNLKPYAKKTSRALNRKNALERRIEVRI